MFQEVRHLPDMQPHINPVKVSAVIELRMDKRHRVDFGSGIFYCTDRLTAAGLHAAYIQRT